MVQVLSVHTGFPFENKYQRYLTTFMLLSNSYRDCLIMWLNNIFTMKTDRSKHKGFNPMSQLHSSILKFVILESWLNHITISEMKCFLSLFQRLQYLLRVKWSHFCQVFTKTTLPLVCERLLVLNVHSSVICGYITFVRYILCFKLLQHYRNYFIYLGK